jgi:hypothetical protein
LRIDIERPKATTRGTYLLLQTTDAGARRHGNRLQSGFKRVRLPPASLRLLKDSQLSTSEVFDVVRASGAPVPRSAVGMVRTQRRFVGQRQKRGQVHLVIGPVPFISLSPQSRLRRNEDRPPSAELAGVPDRAHGGIGQALCRWEKQTDLAKYPKHPRSPKRPPPRRPNAKFQHVSTARLLEAEREKHKKRRRTAVRTT